VAFGAGFAQVACVTQTLTSSWLLSAKDARVRKRLPPVRPPPATPQYSAPTASKPRSAAGLCPRHQGRVGVSAAATDGVCSRGVCRQLCRRGDRARPQGACWIGTPRLRMGSCSSALCKGGGRSGVEARKGRAPRRHAAEALPAHAAQRQGPTVAPQQLQPPHAAPLGFQHVLPVWLRRRARTRHGRRRLPRSIRLRRRRGFPRQPRRLRRTPGAGPAGATHAAVPGRERGVAGVRSGDRGGVPRLAVQRLVSTAAGGAGADAAGRGSCAGRGGPGPRIHYDRPRSPHGGRRTRYCSVCRHAVLKPRCMCWDVGVLGCTGAHGTHAPQHTALCEH
jgi:hypothetical protein